MNIAVFGATSPTGLHVLEQGMRRGHHITAFTRRPNALAGVEGLSGIVSADGRDLAEVSKAVREQEAVIAILSPPGLGPSTVVSDVIGTILRAMREIGVRRIVCVSAHPLVATRPPVLLPLVKWIFRNPYADLVRAERAIVKSGLDWTIVRPTQLADGPGTGQTVIEPGGSDFHTGASRIRRADLAMVLLDAVEQKHLIQRAIEVAGAKSRRASS